MNNHLFLFLLSTTTTTKICCSCCHSVPQPLPLLSLSSHIFYINIWENKYEVLNWYTSERVSFSTTYCKFNQNEQKKKKKQNTRTHALCLIKMWNYCKINVIHATWSSLSHLSSMWSLCARPCVYMCFLSSHTRQFIQTSKWSIYPSQYRQQFNFNK